MKPWKFPYMVGEDDITGRLCVTFHQEWFRIQGDCEREKSSREGAEFQKPEGAYKPEVFQGYCNSDGGGVTFCLEGRDRAMGCRVALGSAVVPTENVHGN